MIVFVEQGLTVTAIRLRQTEEAEPVVIADVNTKDETFSSTAGDEWGPGSMFALSILDNAADDTDKIISCKL